MASTRSSRLWLVSRILLAASLVPLAIAVWALARPVRNPGVQDCGSPAAFLVGGRADKRLPIAGDPDYTPDVPDLVVQPTCTTRVEARLTMTLWAGGVFLVLAAIGAVGGLVDDRVALHRAPRFEALLRERPAEAPGLYWDRPVVPEVDLGVRLPEIETRDVVMMLGTTVGMWLLLGWTVGASALLDSFGALKPVPAVVLVFLAAVTVSVSAGQFLVIQTERWPLRRALAVATATCFDARVRPSFGWSGNWLHRLVRVGTDRSRALFEVSSVATIGVLVHAALLGVLGLVVVVMGPTRHGLESRAWLCVGVVVVLLVLGASSASARYGQLLAPPDRRGLRASGVLVRTEPERFAGLAVAAVVISLTEASALGLSVVAVGGEVPVAVALVVALVAVAAGPLGPVSDGSGVIDAVAVLGLWRFGVDPGAAVAAVVVWRVALRWLPMLPGALVARIIGRQPQPVGEEAGSPIPLTRP